MRLRKLDLIAFGPFTGKSIDLSDGQHGLHLIYGPNEAGKSSTLRGLTDFLFGIPARTDDAFIHPYPVLRIGGVVENQRGETLHCVRRKANQSALRDATETNAIDEGQWSRFIGDVSRELFSTMFGINHESLRIGGDTIANGGGTIGEAIFAGASGVVGLRATQATLREKIDAIFGPSGRRGTLHNLIMQYKSVRDDQRKVSASTEQWTTSMKRLNEIEAREASIRAEWSQANGRRNKLERLKTAIPVASQWQEVERQLAELADAPVLADDFERIAGQRLERKQILESQKRILELKLKSQEAEQRELPDEEHVLALQPRIEALVIRSGEYKKGQSDLPGLRNQLQSEEDVANEILQEMGRAPDLEAFPSLRVSRDRHARIHTLGSQHATLQEQIRGARLRLTRAQHKLAGFALQDADTEPAETELRESLQQVSDTIDRIQELSLNESQLDAMRRQADEASTWIANEAGRLAIDLEKVSRFEIVSLPTLPALDSHHASWQSLRESSKESAAELARLNKKRQDLERQIQKLCRNKEMPTREQWLQYRRDRDAVWQRIAGCVAGGEPVDPALVREFEERVTHVDEFVAQMLDAATELASYEQLTLERDSISQQIQDQQSIAASTEESSHAWEERWKQLWQGIVSQPRSPGEMRDWIARASDLQKRIEAHRIQTRDIQARELECARLRQHAIEILSRAGAKVSSDVPQQRLSEIARSVQREWSEQLQRAESQQQQQKAIGDEIRDAEAELDHANQALQEWVSQWSQDMEILGLSRDALPDQARSVLAQLDEVAEKWKSANNYRKRIQGIERDADTFLQEVKSVADALRIPCDSTSVHQCVNKVRERLDSTIRHRDNRKRIEEQVQQDRNDLAKMEKELDELEHGLHAMICMAGCDSAEELVRAGERSRLRKTSQLQANQLRTQLAGMAQGETVESLVQQALATTVADLEMELSQLQNQIEKLEGDRDEWIREGERLRSEIAGLDHQGKAAELATQASGIAASIESQFEELVLLKWTASVLAEGIERFRQKNQGPLLTAASQAFQHMTLGRYEGLRVDVDEEGDPILVGVRSGSSQDAVAVGQMSDGTRDQLYLSLRIAAIQDWNQRHEPMPFIVDDILIHFDDDRSRATLQQLAAMSDRTQVLFFTHHQHLIELATEAIEPTKLFVHRL